VKDLNRDRQKVVKIFFLIAVLILLGKAAQIQLLDSSYRDKAQATAVNKNTIYPSRGLIYDRNGNLLINNNAMYDIKVTYNQLDPNMDVEKFCALLGIEEEEYQSLINKDFSSNRYAKHKPFIFISKISSNVYARLQEHLHEFPGFSTQLRNVRGYPFGNAPHVLGYLNEVNQDQIDKSGGEYARGDYIGASGLELAYEEELRGKKGVNYVLINNMGREVGPYNKGKQDTIPISGNDLITTLDIDLQSYGELLMQKKTGSIVAIEPATGEILAMVSTPNYDPNRLTINRKRGEAFNELLQDSLNPFFDRSVMAKYPPGSIFKTVVALVALQENISQANRGITCNGGYFYKGRRSGCHNHPYPYNISVALQHSCNAYFFTLIRDIIEKEGFSNPAPGLDMFDQHLYDFGLGKPLEVDIPNELAGNVPTVEYYDYLYPKEKGSWKSPTIMSIGIGQGEIQMTTVQMANLAAIIANHGYYYPPHLAKEFKNENVLIPEKYRTKKTVRVDKKHFVHVIDGMEKAVLDGTARIAQVRDVSVCGKTGTSQNPHGKDHSVFFAFAPKDNPQIAIAVYVEHGIWGASYAAPIAGLMIEKYLKDGEIHPSKKWIEDRMLNANLIDVP
jgi:penicillin-binding protein 2